ncbi:MAG: carnitine O-acetyltransferase [Rhodomicrobium sp.]|nr:MAG: carnitine O-acetyltransferase [Rhodomicrobium sp.]
MNKANQSAEPQPTGKAKTFYYQGKLPKVPLPALEDTKDLFMEWCSPLLTKAEQDATATALEEFMKKGGLGEKTHTALEQFNNNPETQSWLDIFWPSRYLGRRDPIALNANFFFLFRHQDMSQVKRAALIAAAGLNYKLKLDKEEIPVAMNRDTPLEMDQVKYLFSATRIPGETQDSLRSFYSSAQPGPSTARHIIVFYKSHIYELELVAEDGTPYSLSDIELALSHILEAGNNGSPEDYPVGHLTTQPRAKWAKIRADLLKSPQNKANLDSIETALFAINLEDSAPETDLEACNQLLHGSDGNRWYDKALQLIIFKNGKAGINIEHCGLDGTTILNFVDYILEIEPGSIDQSSAAREQGPPPFKLLSFEHDDAMKQQIATAAAEFEQLTTTTATSCFDFKDFGSNHIKTLKMSPDAFVQCAMQLAHKRTKGFIGATYESIATRQFQHGRTEAMRTITPEVITFVDTIESPTATREDKITSFRNAAQKHGQRAKNCQQGNAPEQHLWELLNIYNRNPEKFRAGLMGKLMGKGLSQSEIDKALKLYESPGWIKMRSDALSTSSAPSPTIIYFGFGSTGPGCIGVGYLVRADEMNCYLSTAQGEEQAVASFMENWRSALKELSELLKEPS